MTTGERIRSRRKELSISAEEVAAKLGCSPATIYRYENGAIEKVPIDVLYPISEILQTTPSALMGWEDLISPNIVARDQAACTLIDCCASSEDPYFYLLQVKDKRYYDLQLFCSDKHSEILQIDNILNNFHDILQDHPEHLSLVRKLMHILADGPKSPDSKILYKLFDDYNDGFDEDMDGASII